jgi:hypothetical protein
MKGWTSFFYLADYVLFRIAIGGDHSMGVNLVQGTCFMSFPLCRFGLCSACVRRCEHSCPWIAGVAWRHAIVTARVPMH